MGIFNKMPRAVELLLVEDSRHDIFMFRKAIGEGYRNYNLHVANDGEEALRMLVAENATIPDLIVLDINLPKIHGFELLKIIRRNAQLCDIPVFMLSSSGNRWDVEESQNLEADGYLTKPYTFRGHIEIIDILEQHWMRYVDTVTI